MRYVFLFLGVLLSPALAQPSMTTTRTNVGAPIQREWQNMKRSLGPWSMESYQQPDEADPSGVLAVCLLMQKDASGTFFMLRSTQSRGSDVVFYNSSWTLKDTDRGVVRIQIDSSKFDFDVSPLSPKEMRMSLSNDATSGAAFQTALEAGPRNIVFSLSPNQTYRLDTHMLKEAMDLFGPCTEALPRPTLTLEQRRILQTLEQEGHLPAVLSYTPEIQAIVNQNPALQAQYVGLPIILQKDPQRAFDLQKMLMYQAHAILDLQQFIHSSPDLIQIVQQNPALASQWSRAQVVMQQDPVAGVRMQTSILQQAEMWRNRVR